MLKSNNNVINQISIKENIFQFQISINCDKQSAKSKQACNSTCLISALNFCYRFLKGAICHEAGYILVS